MIDPSKPGVTPRAFRYPNRSDALAAAGETTAALHSLARAAEGLPALPAGGYRQLIEGGIERLRARLERSEA